MTVCNKHKFAHWHLKCPPCLEEELEAIKKIKKETPGEPIKCQRCGCWGGRVVKFTRLSGTVQPRWVCPHCMDKDAEDLKELREKATAMNELAGTMKETFEDWGV